MIDIDLLPRSQRHQRTSSPGLPSPILLGAALALVLGVTGYYAIRFQQLHALQAQVAAEQGRLQTVAAGLQRAAQIAAGEQAADAQAALLQRLHGRTWSPQLLELSKLTPRGVTWLHLSAGSAGIVIEGRAEHMSDLSHFLTALTNSALVDRADLHYANNEPVGTASALHFELALQLAAQAGGNGHGA